MNKKSMNLKYLQIKSDRDLNDAVTFLEKGFKWKKFKSDLVKSKFPIINKHLNFHGIMIKDDKEVIGAILFFHQGFINIENEKRSIINMSSWYMHQKYRGLPSISFLRYMLEEFDNYIFTNYSANNVAEKILLKIGFKKMQLKRTSLLITESIFNFSNIKIKDIHKDSLKIKNNIETILDEGIGIRFLEVKIDRYKLQLITKKRVLRRSIFGVEFNWRTTTIIWTSNEAMLARYWKKICNKLLIYTKSMKLVCDFSSNFPHNAQVKENNYLYFCNNQSLDYIAPIQSEMNIFD